MRASDAGSRLVYFGTRDEVHLGDLIRARALLFLKLEGVICYIPGVSAKHRHMEYDGLRFVGVQLRNGDLRQLHWPAGEVSLDRQVKLLKRGQPYKPLDPCERLDPTALDSDEG